MPIGQINPFFNEYSQPSEQLLLQDLIEEAIGIYGVETAYVSRSFAQLDQVYGADPSSTYDLAWPIAVYVKNVLGFAGDHDFMEKFAGLQIRDQIIVTISKFAFDALIASDANFPPLPNGETFNANRPREGDLIFFPKFPERVFQIKYVNLIDMFYQLGKLYTWECTCELFEYSGEVFNTGIPELDRIQKRGDLNVFSYLMYDTDGVTPILFNPYGDYWVTDAFNMANIDPLDDTQAVYKEANNYINFTEIDPFADEFNQGGTI